jgi:hypothetical protein
MIIGTSLGSLGCGCGLGEGLVPAVALPIATPARYRSKVSTRLVNPYDIMRSGRTPKWYGRDPRYPLTNVSALIAKQVHP